MSRTRFADWSAVARVLGGLLLVYYAGPILALVVAGATGGALSRLRDPVVVRAATTSVAGATTSTLIALVLGVPLAYWLARTEWRFRTAARALAVLPLVVPPTVAGIVLLTVAGPGSPLGAASAAAGLPLTRSFAGVVLAQTFVASPFVVVTATAAFEGADRRLEHASRSLGKGRWTTFRRVALPLAAPGVLAGATLAFARALGEFGATMVMAYYPRTLPIQIWVAFVSFGLERAYPIALLLVAIAAAVLAALAALGSLPGWR
ncbi:MAG: molybdate ABC transporter permease subunit [Halobacteriales archaeon]